MNVDAGFQIADFQGMIRRRAKVGLGVALAVSLAAYWLAMALPAETRTGGRMSGIRPFWVSSM